MKPIIVAPNTAQEAIPHLAALSDKALDELIANEGVVEVVGAVLRLARIERGQRTAQRKGREGFGVTPTLSQVEKNARSEEMLVVRWFQKDHDAYAFLCANGWRKCVTEARRQGYGQAPISKPRLGGGVSHPSRFSDPILDVIEEALPDNGVVLDPFAGTGRIHELAGSGRTTIGVEIEQEWADLHPDTRHGNALDLEAADIEPESVDAIATSPTYGNRLADSHKASDPDARRSYTHDLGHRLQPDNSGSLQWGDPYRRFHEAAYREAIAALRPGGRFVVNISDHIRAGEWQAVSFWHLHILTKLGLEWESVKRVDTRRLRQGENADARAEYEYVIVMTKPSTR